MRTFKVHVIVYAIARNKATVLTRDGTRFGSARLSSFQMLHDLEQHERVLWQHVLHDYRQLHDQGPDRLADDALVDIPDPPNDGAPLDVDVNEHFAMVEAGLDGLFAAEAPPPVLEEVTVIEDDTFACDIFGEDDAKFSCNGACHFCADCLVAYSETLFEGKAECKVPACAQGCGSVFDWKTMAGAIDSDAKFARLFTHFAASPETSTVRDTLKEDATMDSHLHNSGSRHLQSWRKRRL